MNSLLVPDLLRSSVERFPERTAITAGSRRITYLELSSRVEDLTERLLRSGLARGERVLILLENSPEYIVSYFAVMRAGGIVVPVGHQVPERALGRILADCTPSVAIRRIGRMPENARGLHDAPCVRTVIDIDSAEFAKPVADNDREGSRENFQCTAGQDGDVALILYTSGSTGQPKGVTLTHRNLVGNAASIVAYLKLVPQDRGMVILPFHYSYGNSVLTTHVMAGAGLVLENSFAFPNVVLDRIANEQVTGFAGVPTTFAILLNRSNLRTRVFPSLRYVTQAGGAMSPKLAAELREALPNTEIFIMYGQTEATARLTYLDPGEIHRKAGSVGKAIPGVSLTIRGESGAPAAPGELGEIVATGENVMAGYWNDPVETSAVLRDDGLHTGDLGWEDAEGFFYIYGRKSEMIKTGGHRVSPKEIEEVLSTMAGVAEAAVVGVPDEVLLQAINVFVVVAPGDALTENDVMRHCLENLESHMMPKHVVFVDELPKSPNGKVDRTVLRERAVAR